MQQICHAAADGAQFGGVCLVEQGDASRMRRDVFQAALRMGEGGDDCLRRDGAPSDSPLSWENCSARWTWSSCKGLPSALKPVTWMTMSENVGDGRFVRGGSLERLSGASRPLRSAGAGFVPLIFRVANLGQFH
jgi:hypothetical protein